MYSLIVTTKLNDIDPQAWLPDVLAHIADVPQNRPACVVTTQIDLFRAMGGAGRSLCGAEPLPRATIMEAALLG